jgi:hypothetical protein
MSLNLNRVHWYIPSLYGDIRLTANGDSTEIEWKHLSPSERTAMVGAGKRFGFDASADAGKVVVDKPIGKVETVLARSMKRGRKLLSAVLFTNGKIEEMHRSEGSPYRKADIPASSESKPSAAITVAQPTIGCPLPEFEQAEVRATRVLRVFLSPQQLADFERTQSFLATGADTGHLYVLTSRQAPRQQLEKVSGLTVFDATERRAVCVHDWLVPAAEELVELKLFLELPGCESYVRRLPDHGLV